MPKRKRFIRRKLKINEVSLCGDPANPDARIAFHKAQDKDRTMVIPLEKHVSPDEIDIDLSELPEDVRKKILDVLDEAGHDVDEAIDTSGMSATVVKQIEELVKRTSALKEESKATAKRIAELEVKAASAGGQVNGVSLESLQGQLPAEVVKAISLGKDEDAMPKKTVPLSKSIVYAACKIRARELFPDDSPDVAAGKFFQTPDGFRARKAMSKLPGPYQEADTAPVEKMAFEHEAELPAMRKLTEAAQKIRIENPEMTREQSFVRAMDIHPEIYRQCRVEKRALVKKLDPNFDEE